MGAECVRKWLMQVKKNLASDFVDRISWNFWGLAGYCHDNFEGSLTPGLWLKFGVLLSSISVELV